MFIGLNLLASPFCLAALLLSEHFHEPYLAWTLPPVLQVAISIVAGAMGIAAGNLPVRHGKIAATAWSPPARHRCAPAFSKTWRTARFATALIRR